VGSDDGPPGAAGGPPLDGRKLLDRASVDVHGCESVP